ncbi:SirB2 family protein [Oleiharenicola lentus]|uniref:SirB2 family protein n=1 Tax=Oleiharenicola lentus TaxID=2508720 RepID=UPI003F679609
MSPTFYHILHVFSLFVLIAHTFMAFANPDPVNKKRTMIITGVAGLLVLVSGFGLISKVYSNQFYAWMFVKLGCWLVLAALGGVVYRKPHLRATLSFITLALVLVALVMVYLKPFAG